jgi:hypothetical protein
MLHSRLTYKASEMYGAMKTRELSILAYFTHDMRYGGIVGGAERRFLEITKILREKNVEVNTIEFFPSLSKTWYGVANSASETIRVERYNRVINLILELRLLIIQGIRVAKKERVDLIYVTRHDMPENLIPGYKETSCCDFPPSTSKRTPQPWSFDCREKKKGVQLSVNRNFHNH